MRRADSQSSRPCRPRRVRATAWSLPTARSMFRIQRSRRSSWCRRRDLTNKCEAVRWGDNLARRSGMVAVSKSKAVRRVAIVIAVTCVLGSRAAHAYRPFDGTDGDVAETGDIELELGPLHAGHTGGAAKHQP